MEPRNGIGEKSSPKKRCQRQTERNVSFLFGKKWNSNLFEEFKQQGIWKDTCWIVGISEQSEDCTSIALYEGNQPVVGIVYFRQKNALYYGIQGSGAYWNGHLIQPSEVTGCANAVIRECGLATVGGILVVCGKLDAYLGKPMSLQEIAAATIIAHAAGGVAYLKREDEKQYILQCFAT